MRCSSTVVAVIAVAVVTLGACQPEASFPLLGDADTEGSATPPHAGLDAGLDARPGARGVAWVRLAAGTFSMGSPIDEPCREPNGIPERRHLVTLTRPFELAATEVTQADFEVLLGYNPSHFRASGSARPVENVSWHEAAAYCNALSMRAGLTRCYLCEGKAASVSCAAAAGLQGCAGYRLPTEAEWEFAYRAGSDSAYHNGPNDPDACAGRDAAAERIAWGSSNSSSATHAVAGKQPNAWGLYDLAGNVWEWTHDGYDGDLGSAPVSDPAGAPAASLRVLRGGSWFNDARNLRAANRYFLGDGVRVQLVGLRCARSLVH